MAKQKAPREIVRDGVIKLLVEDPFWACVIMRLKIMMTRSLVESLGTDGKYLVVNENWIATRSFMEGIAGFVHEACHIALKHNFRRGNRNFLIWNYACDYAINQLIMKKTLPDGTTTGYDIPATWLYDPRFNGLNAEQIYDILLTEAKQAGGAGGTGSGGNGPKMFDPNGSGIKRPDGGDILFDYPALTPEEKRTAEEMTDVSLQGIYAAAKQAGKAPGFVKIELEARHRHVIDYKELLRDWLTKNIFTQDYSWLVPDRRFVGTGFHIPALVDGHDGAPSILLCCDVSGSMLNEKDMPIVASEIQGVLEEFPGKYFVIYTDTEFKGVQEVSYEKPLVLKFEGGGGTDFRAIMEHVKTSELDFDAVLFFTDMETNHWGENPGKPVLWMNTNRHNHRTPGFGKIIDIHQSN